MLLATVMAVWTHHVKNKAAVETSTFLDDRTIWAKGEVSAADMIMKAIAASDEVDRKFGSQLNRKKCQLAGSSARVREALNEAKPEAC